MLKTDRPKRNASLATIDIALELITLAIVVAIWIYVITVYALLPDTIASHFNLKGEADGFSNKTFIWFVPTLTTVLSIGLYILCKYPWLHNYMVNITEENAVYYYGKSNRVLRFVNMFLALVFLYVVYSIIENAKGNQVLLQSSFIYIIVGISIVGPIALFMYMSKGKK